MRKKILVSDTVYVLSSLGWYILRLEAGGTRYRFRQDLY